MEPAAFLKGRTRETAIRRDALGHWYDGPDPLTHPRLVESFDGWIRRAEDGRYCLSNDINWAYISLEGPPFFVRGVTLAPQGVQLRLSGGGTEWLDPQTLRQGPDGALYCSILAGELTARFDNSAAAGLESLLGEDEKGVYIALGGARVRPPVTDAPIR
ncbi:MAG: hypothetical protein OXU20_02975 [Myxococcales bacterium]|nr:hypothetical protein [Myxococcales bacterium]MDD9971827.1 hypothetical protein [Myxococcales bacterium]